MVLQKIIDQKRKEIVNLPKLNQDMLTNANGDFAKKLSSSGVPIIAELKSKSPSEGVIDENYHPEEIAKAYQKGGASALSILTDNKFFGGSFDDIKKVKSVCDLPVLCKEFIIDPIQIYHARAAGADACLLIVRCLDEQQLAMLYKCVSDLGMDALIEVFDESEMQSALKVGAKIIGVNNRNLDTLEMDMGNIERLAKIVPDDVMLLSLSGAKTPADLHFYATQYDGVLAGTALMRAKDKEAFLQSAIHP
ncbi:indole-3-glycerol phosphate synthase TrpC [Fangia hongkongensis]|uniref:indole-3-glycerol phosphate synthase TrpC n=1 Tax=Fangia hongkongensis TaxID=270495 RepID=UPI00035F7C99|nr:indole-3-glycerol phosphate synthase TrpC [Fangia hongkongensis]MBK2124775.1 indole-3-glycerol phosphate synthase TrpC [Fangia hongkongensis]